MKPCQKSLTVTLQNSFECKYVMYSNGTRHWESYPDDKANHSPRGHTRFLRFNNANGKVIPAGNKEQFMDKQLGLS